MVKRELLEKYVAESNAIGDIREKKDHYLFADHLKTAELVAQRAEEFKIVMPESIHRILMEKALPDAGKFRQVPSWADLVKKAAPENVGKLMERWQEALLHDIWKAPEVEPSTAAEIAWHYHHWFEAIHPFVDGNGRTGRLILNNILLLFGLPWHVISFSERGTYYENIRQWEMKHQSLLEVP